MAKNLEKSLEEAREEMLKSIKAYAELLESGLSAIGSPAMESTVDNATDDEDDKPLSTEKVRTPQGTLSEQDLDGMTYNDLKKLAKDMGISAKGNREQLTEAILSTNVDVDTDEEDEPEEKPTKRTAAKKPAKKKPEPEPEPEDEEEDDGEDEESDTDTDELVAQVEATLEEMENEEIAELLANAGLSTKGKRTALVSRVVEAVLDGKIEFGDEEDEEDDEDDGTDINDVESSDLTDERREALIKLRTTMEKNFKSGKLKKVTIKKVLKTSPYANDMDGMSDEELLAAYIDYKSCFIDDDGESHGTEEPYMVNGAAFCCGAELAFDDETSTYVCEVCGAEYDDEDEE